VIVTEVFPVASPNWSVKVKTIEFVDFLHH
jgi:hypothetical protein